MKNRNNKIIFQISLIYFYLYIDVAASRFGVAIATWFNRPSLSAALVTASTSVFGMGVDDESNLDDDIIALKWLPFFNPTRDNKDLNAEVVSDIILVENTVTTVNDQDCIKPGILHQG